MTLYCTLLIVGENLMAASGPGERTNERSRRWRQPNPRIRQSCICSASSLSHTVHETHVLPDPRVNICAEWRQTPTWYWWETSSPCSSRSRSQSTVIKELYMHGLRICRWSEPPSTWPYGRHARARALCPSCSSHRDGAQAKVYANLAEARMDQQINHVIIIAGMTLLHHSLYMQASRVETPPTTG